MKYNTRNCRVLKMAGKIKANAFFPQKLIKNRSIGQCSIDTSNVILNNAVNIWSNLTHITRKIQTNLLDFSYQLKLSLR